MEGQAGWGDRLGECAADMTERVRADVVRERIGLDGDSGGDGARAARPEAGELRARADVVVPAVRDGVVCGAAGARAGRA